MIPFFGGSVKQNMDINSHKQTLDLFTGNFTYDKPKKETTPLFEPQLIMVMFMGTKYIRSTIRIFYHLV